MKRALSFILALTLALTLLPTFAMAVDMEPAELKPQKFEIDFSDYDLEKQGKTALSDFLNVYNASYPNRYEVKNNLTYFYGENWTFYTTKASSNIYYRTKTNGDPATQIVTYYTTDSGNYFNFDTNPDDIVLGYHTVGFDIVVPAAGYYDITADVYVGSNGGNAEVFIDGKSVGTVDIWAKNKVDMNGYSKVGKNTVEYGKNVYLNAGTNRLKIKNTVHGENSRVVNGFYGFTFTPSAKQVNPNVSFVQTTNVDEYNDITVETVARGDSVALTAHNKEIPGYEFVGWKRGANDDDSAWIDISGDSYNIWTNTFLTAIYKPISEEATATVDFWNQNGAYLGTATEATYATDVTRVPTLTGFGNFLGWFTDGNVKLTPTTELKTGITNAVAQYEAKAVSGVKFDGNDVADADSYNKEVTLTSSGSSTCWKRDGKIISYDENYTYNVWGATNITEGNDVIADKVPVAILEYSADYGAYMFEYDDGDYAIAEAGVIFGDSVDSCTKKYTSQRKVSHNQFSVPAEAGTAKGYIIWKNASGAYQIDYFTE